MGEIAVFFEKGSILRQPFVLVGFFGLIFLLVVRLVQKRIPDYETGNILTGLLVILGIVVVLSFVYQFYIYRPEEIKYYVVGVFKTKQKKTAITIKHKLRHKGFHDADYVHISNEKKYNVFVGVSYKCTDRCTKISDLKESVISKTIHKDAYIWAIKK